MGDAAKGRRSAVTTVYPIKNSASVLAFVRYVLAGVCNTAVGYCLFAGLNYLLQGTFHYSYLAASILANILAITFAYLNYKFIVFRTRGNYLREYLRFYVVYGFSIGLSLVLMPIFVEELGMNTYVAGAAILPICVIASFFGHKSFSFRGNP